MDLRQRRVEALLYKNGLPIGKFSRLETQTREFAPFISRRAAA
jgi:hypothetical protein